MSIVFNKKTKLSLPLKTIFKYLQRKSSVPRCLPPSMEFIEESGHEILQEGDLVKIRVKLGFISKICNFTCSDCKTDELIEFKLKSFFFKSWCFNTKIKEGEEAGEVILEDHLEIELKFPVLLFLLKPLIKFYCKNWLLYRHEILKDDLDVHYQEPKSQFLNILIVGGSGMIGKELSIFLRSQGHNVIHLSHRHQKRGAYWNPKEKVIDIKSFESIDAVINLAGEPIDTRWTDKKKESIYASRIDSTKFLVDTIKQSKIPPRVLINASGISIYGISSIKQLHEESELGQIGFLTNLAKDWEAAANEAQKSGCRVVLLRMAAVLSPKGGLLKKILPIFKIGIGGRLGNGHQIMSWIAIDDVVDAIYFAILNPKINGPLNLSAPYPVSNFSFKETLAQKIGFHAWLPIPTSLIKLFFGQMGTETILSSLKVYPQKLLAAGYKFRYPKIDKALDHLLR